MQAYSVYGVVRMGFFGKHRFATSPNSTIFLVYSSSENIYNMNNYTLVPFLFGVIFFLYSCTEMNPNNKVDGLLEAVFDENELESVTTILNFYDNWIVQNTGINKIDSAYITYFYRKEYNVDLEQFYEMYHIPQRQLDSIILICEEKWTFHNLWEYEYIRYKRVPDTLFVGLYPNIHGVYWRFVEALQKESDIITPYIESIESAGDYSHMLMYGIPLASKEIDFTKEYWRLFYALHFIAVNYNVRYARLNE